MTQEQLQSQIASLLLTKKALVKRRAHGLIRYDYLVPGGPYEELWDWDGFFIGASLAMDIPSEAIFLKNWCLNYLKMVERNGFTPGLLTPRGPDNRLKHIKPFLAQGCYFASVFLNDFSWIEPCWNNLKKSVSFRTKSHFDTTYHLGCWNNSMESGADNNIAVINFPEGTVLATDLNTFLYREYRALSKIARKLNRSKEANTLLADAYKIKKSIRKFLWDPDDQIFYNINRTNGHFIRHVSYNSIIPLWAGIAAQDKGRIMIRRYLLNSNKLFSSWGIRTLAKDDVSYNQKNVIKPYSNWQGPVWPIVNYFAIHALLNYGFQKEALLIAERVTRMCLKDIKTTGGMHENYHAETGKPLAAPNFISWNLLVGQMIPQAEKRKNPLAL